MKKLLLILIAFGLNLTDVQAQKFLKKLQEKVENSVERKVEQRVDKKIDEGVDKGLDATEEGLKGNGQMEQSKDIDEKNIEAALSSDLSKKAYTFNFSIDYTLSSNDSKDLSNLICLQSTDASYSAMRIEQNEKKDAKSVITVILDGDESLTLMDTEGMKIQTKTRFDNKVFTDIGRFSNKEEGSKQVRFEKTGNTKSILGYPCSEYLFSSEDGSGSMYLCEALGQAGNLYYINADEGKGQIMEYKYTDNKRKKSSSALVATRVNNDASVKVNAADYKSIFGN